MSGPTAARQNIGGSTREDAREHGQASDDAPRYPDSRRFASSATCRAVRPNSSYSTSPGADAPKWLTPIATPSRPTYRSHPRRVAHNIFNPPERQVPVDYTAMPAAIFSSPQVATVGLTEQAAVEQSVPYLSATYDYSDTAYGSSIEDRDGFVKVLAHHETDKILGCHIIGAHASILIQEVANAMRLGLTTDAISQSIYVHPALPEVVQRAFGSLGHG